jgi:hypothetical protein
VFGTVFVLQLQKHILILHVIWSLIITIDIHTRLPHPTWLQLAKTIPDMCWNEKQTGYWGYFGTIFLQVLSRKPNGQV